MQLRSLISFPDTLDEVIFPNLMDSESEAKIKRFLAIMDSMTNKGNQVLRKIAF